MHHPCTGPCMAQLACRQKPNRTPADEYALGLHYTSAGHLFFNFLVLWSYIFLVLGFFIRSSGFGLMALPHLETWLKQFHTIMTTCTIFKTLLSPYGQGSREGANLNERKNPHTHVCIDRVWLKLITFQVI